MKKIFTISAFLFIGSSTFGQLVPNGNFEGPPFNWVENSGLGEMRITSSYTVNLPGESPVNILPFEGKAFAALSNKMVLDTARYRKLGQKFAFSQRPEFFRLMYNYIPAGKGEVGAAIIKLTKYNSATMQRDIVLNDSILFTARANPWTKAELDLKGKYKMTDNPDTAWIYFATSVTDSVFEGTTLTVDNIDFVMASISTEEFTSDIFGQTTISPNPVSDIAEIGYQLSANSAVNMELYDMAGQRVMEILNEEQNFGAYTRKFNVSDLKQGLYFLKLSTNTYSVTEKVVVAR